MTTPARPGSFTGATDNAANGGLFTDTLIDGIPDIVGADVARAETAATNAENSATGAATSATNASTSETNAATSATSASTSATNAATSATNAATSASTTAADAATATTKAGEAATSATNAAGSETAAAGSATSASSSATSATSSANTAVTSASAAGTSATNAATSETNSANSATASATSATASANSATASATSATAAQTAQTAAELAETNAETAETNAETAETGAATSATNAANSASAASTSETNAATSATNSANSATASATSATASANSATAAAASEAAAAGYVDNFDDKYLGAKTSDPTVDNDGDPLTDGALYYNTTDNRMKVYDLGTTTWLFLAPTDAEITNINTVANDITNVNTVATNITDVNNFADTYFISATAPASPTTGDLWFDTTNSIMKVYDGSGFVNAGSSVNGTSARYNYTATAGQTTFAAVYDTGYVDVYLNGAKLAPADFTATNGSSIVLTSGAALDDTVDIVGYGTFSVASAVTLPDNVKATFGDSADLQIYHDGTDSVIKDTGTGNLVVTSNGGGIFFRNDAETETYANFNNNGSVQLRYNNNAKLETTSGGIDVTGKVTAQALDLGTNNPRIRFDDSDTSNNGEVTLDNNSFRIEADEDNTVADSKISFRVDASEKAFINSSGLNVTGTVTATAFSGDGSGLTGISSDLVDDTTPQLGGDLQSNGNDVVFADNDKAIFGAGNDLQIYHSGTHSFIDDSGVGNLYIRSSDIRIQKYTGENMIVATADDDVTLYYDNSAKLATTNTGVAVTGTITATAINVPQSSQTSIGATCMGWLNNTTTNPGTSRAGTSISFSNTIGDYRPSTFGVGTWRCHGAVESGSLNQEVSVWQRIS